jgi:hypothetical protein
MFKNEWVVAFNFSHHMAKHASLFSSLDIVAENKIYVG